MNRFKVVKIFLGDFLSFTKIMMTPRCHGCCLVKLRGVINTEEFCKIPQNQSNFLSILQIVFKWQSGKKYIWWNIYIWIRGPDGSVLQKIGLYKSRDSVPLTCFEITALIISEQLLLKVLYRSLVVKVYKENYRGQYTTSFYTASTQQIPVNNVPNY